MLDCRFAILCAALLMLVSGEAALAQSRTFPLRVPSQSSVTGDGNIQVSVSYSLSLPLKNDDVQVETLEKARRALYGIAASECKVLLDTIASTCTLGRLNVNSSVRHQRGEDQVSVNGNATYVVSLK